MAKNYNEAEDLLSDESFLDWYFKRPGKENQRWDSWISGDPEKAQLVQQAIRLLEATRLPEPSVPMQQMAMAEKRLLARIDQGSAQIRPLFNRRLFNRRRWLVAAAVLVLFAAGLIVTVIRPAKGVVIKTAFGELTHRELPDGTEVMMDANSSIRFGGNWKEGTDREVWMNGEAFFHVRKTQQNNRFVVHLDHGDVIVTGTKFNVINRHGAENIMLEEGSVLLRSCDGSELKMTPGDFADLENQRWEKKTVQRDSLMAWKEQKLVFDGTPLRELVTIINDHYGVHIKLADPSIGDQTISAILPNDNLDVLLQSLEATADFEITRDGDQIIIRARSLRN